jgi:hypothetical protein
MPWSTLPISTEAEATDYAEACAQRWCEAVQLGRPLTREEWQAVNPPDMLRIPEAFWAVVHARLCPALRTATGQRHPALVGLVPPVVCTPADMGGRAGGRVAGV